MKEIFNLKRFGLLARRHYAANGKFYLLDVLGTLCVFAIVYYFGMKIQLSRNGSTAGQETVMMICLPAYLIQIFIWINRSMKGYAARFTQIAEMTLPSSTFEKYLFAWLNSSVVATLVYVGLFVLTDAVVGAVSGFSGINYAAVARIPLRQIWHLTYPLVMFHAFLFFCHAAFGRRYLAGWILTGVGLLLCMVLTKGIYHHFTVGGDARTVFQVNQTALVNLQDGIVTYFVGWPFFSSFFYWVGWWLTWAVLFIGGYFKLRERPVK